LGKNPECKIIWDPILKASAGFEFHSEIDKKRLKEILRKLYLITPNVPEIVKLSGEKNLEAGAKSLSECCKVLLKGGHVKSDQAKDLLFTENEIVSFDTERISGDKHGTGCILSAAILSNLANESSLEDSCRKAKEYITGFIGSHESLLGYHNV
jgi:hydroxymethylpyrimidine/phosphomethylpyrimidine kinase